MSFEVTSEALTIRSYVVHDDDTCTVELGPLAADPNGTRIVLPHGTRPVPAQTDWNLNEFYVMSLHILPDQSGVFQDGEKIG